LLFSESIPIRRADGREARQNIISLFSDGLSMAIKKGARVAVENALRVKKGETALIVTDTGKEKIAEALFDAVSDVGGEPVIVKMLPRKRHGEEPPKAVANMMLDAQVIVGVTTFSFSHTQARINASRAGARIATMPGITEDMMSDGAMLADYVEIERTMRRLYRKLRGAKKIEVYSDEGTDLTMKTVRRDWITDDTGICHKRGAFTNLPAGELFIAPVEGSAEGKVVVDGAFHDVLDDPATIHVKDGIATRITGAKSAVAEMNKGGRDGRLVCEFGMGLNPRARLIGNFLEDDKVLGTAHISFGDNSTFGGRIKCGVHVDAIMRKPRVLIDDRLVLEEGELKI
jgi:leucyl aminopeptidase (aminopeptidase T)